MERRNFTDENKTDFLEWFIEDDQLCKALINNDRNFLDISITQDQKDALIFDQIFPYKFAPDIKLLANSYIMMSFNYAGSKSNELFLISDIIIWCFCRENLIRTKYKYLRYDFMKQRICTILQDKMDNSWVGKTFLNPVREMPMNESGTHYGVELRFSNQVLK